MTTVTVRSTSGFQQEVVCRNHSLLADEPAEMGGGDTGPNPYELLLGSLGACKSITVLMYARRKGWDLQTVEVELTHSKEYARDCEDCDEKSVRIDRISTRLTFRGNLDESQHERLKQIAGRCPVHQTLMGTIEIVDAE